MCDKQQILGNQQQSNIPYKHCLNCGAELSGAYCHECGQEATDPKPSIGGFVMEYLNNAFMWDTKLLQTLWLLVRRPGYLTSEFMSGKFISYMHPLKLNMFILFVFITLFLLFSGTENLQNSVTDIANDDRVFSLVQMESVAENPEYIEKMNVCPRDTVKVLAPLYIARQYPEMISILDVEVNTNGEALDKWTAVLPAILVEDKILVPGDDGYYQFNSEVGTTDNIEIFNRVWKQLVELIAQYFPMIVLLTAPLLSFSVRLVQRKEKRPHINHFIFALHYTAFLELLILLVYILFLITDFFTPLLKWIVISGSCVYLTMAFRQAYGTSSWFKAIAKALFTSLGYILICGSIFVCIFLGACIIVAAQMAKSGVI